MRQIKNVVFDFGGVIIDIDRDCAVKKFVEIGVKDADNLLDKMKVEIRTRKLEVALWQKMSCFLANQRILNTR